MRKKQQTTEHEDSHDHIISHHAPAALLRAEKNIIKLGSNVCVCVYIYTVYIYIRGVNFNALTHVIKQKNLTR